MCILILFIFVTLAENININYIGTGYWKRNQHVGLKHADTGKYLATHKRFRFDNSNCPNCPINGQIEVMATGSRRDSGIDFKWKADLGVYFHQDEDDEDSLQDEL